MVIMYPEQLNAIYLRYLEAIYIFIYLGWMKFQATDQSMEDLRIDTLISFP